MSYRVMSRLIATAIVLAMGLVMLGASATASSQENEQATCVTAL